MENVYGDTLIVNHLLIAFWQIDNDYIEAGSSDPQIFNNLHFLYNNEHINKSIPGENWDNTAREVVRAFREASLRYRTTPRYSALMNSLRTGKNALQFEKHWQAVSSHGSDREITMDFVTMAHERFGNLHVAASSSLCITPQSELFITHYSPVDRHTAKAFVSMMDEVGEGAIRFPLWNSEK